MSKPISEKQLAANRANAKKSRGPITPGGRRNSSRNSVRHGLYAQCILLPGESRDRYLKLLSDLTTEFNATTPSELDLVETMAFCRWRLLRIWTLQAFQIGNEQRRQADIIGHEDPPTQTILASDTLNRPPSLLETFSRLEIRCDRQYYRAADRLRRLKEMNMKNEERSRAIEENKAQSPKSNPIRPVIDP